MLKEKDFLTRILYLVKLIFKSKGEIKMIELCVLSVPSCIYMPFHLLVSGFPDKLVKSSVVDCAYPPALFLSFHFFIALSKSLRMINNIGDEEYLHFISTFSKIIFSIYHLSMILVLTLKNIYCCSRYKYRYIYIYI